MSSLPIALTIAHLLQHTSYTVLIIKPPYDNTRYNDICDGPTAAYRIHFTGEEDYT